MKAIVSEAPPVKGGNPVRTRPIKPLTITITGKLASDLRACARGLGMSVKTLAPSMARSGLHMVEHDQESLDYRLALAAHELGLPLELAAHLRSLHEQINAAKTPMGRRSA